MQMVDHSLADQPQNTIWGGPSYGTGVRPLGPEPPEWGPEKDNYTWGVGEEADIITFLPIFNPKDTQWTFPDKIWNFRHGTETPRRTAVITMGRYSRRLLDLVHRAQATQGLGLASEMTGPSWALYHGLKAVHVPHPIFADGQWTPQELARIYNRGPPENINGGPDSIWNFDHLFDHITYRLTYMFTTHTAEDLYRRWMGFRTAANAGGKRVCLHFLLLPLGMFRVILILVRCSRLKSDMVGIAFRRCFCIQSRTRTTRLDGKRLSHETSCGSEEVSCL